MLTMSWNAQSRLSIGVARTGQSEIGPCNNTDYDDVINKLIIEKLIAELIPYEEEQARQDAELTRLENLLATSSSGDFLAKVEASIDFTIKATDYFSLPPVTTWYDECVPITDEAYAAISPLPKLIDLNTVNYNLIQKTIVDVKEMQDKLDLELWPSYFKVSADHTHFDQNLVIKPLANSAFVGEAARLEAFVNLVELYPLFSYCAGMDNWGAVHDPHDGLFFAPVERLGWGPTLTGNRSEPCVYVIKYNTGLMDIWVGELVGLKNNRFEYYKSTEEIVEQLEKMYLDYGRPKHIKKIINYIARHKQLSLQHESVSSVQ